MFKKIFAVTLAALMVCTSLAACGSNAPSAPAETTPQAQSAEPQKTGPSKEPVELNLWYSANESDPNDRDNTWMKQNVEEFQKLHDNIKFNVTVIGGAGGADYRTKLMAEIAAGNPPDVFMQWGWGRLIPFAESGKLYDLTDFIANDPELSNVVNPGNMAGVTYDGRYYGLPISVDAHGLFYNKKIFKECGVETPTSVDELLEISKVFLDKGITPISFGNSVSWAISIPYSTLLADIGGEEFTADLWNGGPKDFTAEPYIKAMEELKRIVDANVFTPNFNGIQVPESVAAFKDGKAAMLMQGTWQIKGLVSALGDDVGFIPFPTLSGQPLQQKVGAKAYSVSATTQHPDEALEFLKFLYSPARQQALSDCGALLPTQNIDIDLSAMPPVSQDVVKLLNQTEMPYTYTFCVATPENLTTEAQNVVQACTEGANILESFQNLQKFNEQFK